MANLINLVYVYSISSSRERKKEMAGVPCYMDWHALTARGNIGRSDLNILFGKWIVWNIRAVRMVPCRRKLAERTWSILSFGTQSQDTAARRIALKHSHSQDSLRTHLAEMSNIFDRYRLFTAEMLLKISSAEIFLCSLFNCSRISKVLVFSLYFALYSLSATSQYQGYYSPLSHLPPK